VPHTIEGGGPANRMAKLVLAPPLALSLNADVRADDLGLPGGSLWLRDGVQRHAIACHITW